MVRQNNNLVVLGFLICLSGMAGCSKQLNQVPQTTITDANFWNTPNDLALACNYLYSALPGFRVSTFSGLEPAFPRPYEDLYSNDAFGQISNPVSNGTRLAPANSFEWTNYYRLIRAANNILEKSGGVEGDAADINKYIGEARFFRAWGYYELVKRFGDVPYISTTLTMEDSLLFTGRTDRNRIMDSIYADLEFAAAHCPAATAQPASEYGRITASAASAFESRAALFAGTWNKYHGGGDAIRHLQVAVEASGRVIGSTQHGLFIYTPDPFKSYYYLFQYAGEGRANRENILVRLYGQNQTNNISSHSYVRSSLEQGNIAPTRAFMDAYLYTDGLPQGVSPYDSSSMQTSSLTEFRNRDPRIGMTVFNKTDLIPTIVGLLPYSPGIQYRLKKYFITEDWAPNVSFVDFMVIRYAEVLLNNAEALYELNGSITDEQLNSTVNLLRFRVGMPLLTNALVTDNGLDMLEEIRRERRIELSFEGFHYWDLLRWKTAEIELPKDVLGPKYFPEEMINIPGSRFTQDGFVIREDASMRTFNPLRDYLWPLPTKELGLTPGMDQNPNW